MDNDTISLLCLLKEDQSLEKVFPVSINKNKTVGKLKIAIKEMMKPKLDNICITELVVYGVSIPPENDKIRGVCRQIEQREILPVANPIQRVGEAFSFFTENVIHVIVEVPGTLLLAFFSCHTLPFRSQEHPKQ